MARARKRAAKKVPVQAVLRGRGDYDVVEAKPGKKQAADTGVPATLGRIERKLDSLKSSTPSGPGAALGRTLGSMVGQGDLGASAGSALSKYFGFGDYVVKYNSLIKGAGAERSTSIPVIDQHGRRGVRFQEREYLGDVVSGSGTPSVFSNRGFRINPADPGTFPWLSTVAGLFEEWEPHGIVFEYVSTSADFGGGSTQALGTVIGATEYDPADALYPNKVVMESSDYAKSVRASYGCEFGIECDPAERPTRVLYTAIVAPSTNADKRLSDLGTFQIATQGMPTAGVTTGEIWVSYDIVFWKKQVIGSGLGGNILDLFVSGTAGAATTNDPIGTTWSLYGTMVPASVTSSAGGFTVSFPASLASGTFELTYFCTAGTSVTFTNPTVFVLNASIVATFTGGTAGIGYAGSGAVNGIFRAVIQVGAPNAAVTVANIAIVGTASAQLRLYQINQAPLLAQ